MKVHLVIYQRSVDFYLFGNILLEHKMLGSVSNHLLSIALGLVVITKRILPIFVITNANAAYRSDARRSGSQVYGLDKITKRT